MQLATIGRTVTRGVTASISRIIAAVVDIVAASANDECIVFNLPLHWNSRCSVDLVGPAGNRVVLKALNAHRGIAQQGASMAETDVILVTGSSGLIGSAFIRAVGSRARLVGFDSGGAPFPPAEAECVCVDLTSDRSVEDGLGRVRFAYGDRIASVIHLAAYYDFSGAPSSKYDEVTVRGTQRLLRALTAFRVEQFVFSSSMLVHAPCERGERIRETSPLAPKWDYPRSKVTTEELIRKERGLVPVVILRIAGVYEDRRGSVPIARQIQRIFERQLTSRFFPGDASHGQSAVHLDDVVDALKRCVSRRASLPGETTLLIGEPDVTSYADLQRVLGELIHGEPWPTRRIPKSLAKVGSWLQLRLHDARLAREPFIRPWMIDLADDHFALDITQARELLGWAPRHSLHATLPALVERLKSDPLAWYRENHIEPSRRVRRAAGSPRRQRALTATAT